jgi:hypothetical protein
MKLTVKDINGKDQGELEVKFPLIENGQGTEAVQQTVVAYRAAQRMGTACTKMPAMWLAPTKSPGAKKAPGAPAPARFNHPCGAEAASSLARNRAILPRKQAGPPANWPCARP